MKWAIKRLRHYLHFPVVPRARFPHVIALLSVARLGFALEMPLGLRIAISPTSKIAARPAFGDSAAVDSNRPALSAGVLPETELPVAEYRGPLTRFAKITSRRSVRRI